MANEKPKSLKKNALLYTIKSFLELCFPLITFPYSSRVLGPEKIGMVHFAQSIVSYFSILATLGIGTYAVREAAKVRNDPVRFNLTVKELLTINLISTFISYFLLFISLLFIKKFNEYKQLIIICSTLIMFTTIGISWLYQAIENYKYITIRSILFQIFSVILLFVFVKSEDDYLWYAAINVISNVGANICNIFNARKYISFKKANCEKMHLKRHLKPIFILFASAIAGTIFSHIDTTMLGFLSTDAQVGFYSAGVKIVRMITRLFPAVVAVIFPRISYYVSNNNMDSISKLSEKTTNTLNCISIPLTFGIFLLMEPLVLLFCGNTFADAITVSKIMSPYIFLCALSGFFGSGLIIAFGKELWYLISMLSAALIDIILNALFIPKFGANGAAFSTLLTELFLFISYSIYLRKLVSKLKIKLNFLEFLFASLVMSFVIILCKSHFDNLYIELFVSTLIGIFVYFGLLFAVKNKYCILLAKELLKKKNRSKNTE
ncbi:MAG: flippase [Treponema sp.]|nr:flippase [Treponema sp.]